LEAIVWRNRNFDFMVASLFISRAGDTFTFLALAIQVDSLFDDPTKSAGALAAVLMAFALPQVVFGLFAGTLVDRWDRRRTMVAADLARAALIPGFLLLRTPADIPWAMALAFATSSFGSFFYPARTALLPALVKQDDLMQANSWMQVGETFSRLLGPVLAGVVIGAFGSRAAFLVDSASFIGSALFLAAIHGVKTREDVVSTEGLLSAVNDLKSGVRYALGSRLLQGITLGLVLALLGIGGVDVLIVPFTRYAFHAAPEALGLLMTAQGVGMVAGGLLTSALARKVRPLTISVTSMLVLCVVVAAFGMAPTYLVGLLLIPWAGLTLAPLNASLQTMLQQGVPSHMLGRAGALTEVASTLAQLASMGGAGGLAGLVGLRPTFVLGGSLLGIGALVMGGLLRNEAPLPMASVSVDVPVGD
jgi:DHA3 family macrolide efflux protein-like MFS transporter